MSQGVCAEAGVDIQVAARTIAPMREARVLKRDSRVVLRTSAFGWAPYTYSNPGRAFGVT
jgi:hypothetical protein